MAELGEMNELREIVRERYAAAASASTGCCGSSSSCCGTEEQADCFGSELYGASDRGEIPEGALDLSLGCGNPTAVAELHDGDVVLDLGSGAGADALLSARRVSPSGHVYGLDMTDEMLEAARAHAREAGVANVEFLKGYIEEIPLPDASVDVVISNCVINLSADKSEVMREVARVLRPEGRFAVTDIVADEAMSDEIRLDMEQWTGCIAGALTKAEFVEALRSAGLEAIEIEETHRVHDSASSAIVRARKPAAAATAA